MMWDHAWTKTARFWIYVNNDYVKISLKPGQTLDWYVKEATDEGWSGEGLTFQYDEGNGRVIRESVTEGRDCDGLIQYFDKAQCAIENFRDGDETFDMIEEHGKVVQFPSWERVTSEVYDDEAQKAGY